MASSGEENVLLDLVDNRRWDDAMGRIKTEEGREELRRKGRYGRLPLHQACGSGAPLELVEAMVEGYPEAVRVTTNDGYIPLHWACGGGDESPRVVRLLLDAYPEGAKAASKYGQLPLPNAAYNNAPSEVLEMLIDAHPEGVTTRDKSGSLPLHELAREASPDEKEDVEKVEVLIRPLLDNEEACRAAGRDNGMLPLHIASKFGLSTDILLSLLSTYGDAAKETCERGDERVYALDLLEGLRSDSGTAQYASKSDESAASPNLEQGDAATGTPTADGGWGTLGGDDLVNGHVAVVPLSNRGRTAHSTTLASEDDHGTAAGIGIGAGYVGGGPATASSPVAAGSVGHDWPSQSDRATTTGFSIDLTSPSHSSNLADRGHVGTSINDRQPPGESRVPYSIEHAQRQPQHMRAQQHQPHQPNQCQTAAMGARPADHDVEGATEAPMQIEGYPTRQYRYDADDEIAYSSTAVASATAQEDRTEPRMPARGATSARTFNTASAVDHGGDARVMKHDACSAGSVKRRRIVHTLSGDRPANRSDEAITRQQQPTKPAELSESEFNEKSDLLFSYNPDILPYRKDESRLKRFVGRISVDARERNLSEPSRRVWLWMCTFANADDPGDNYVSEINTILGGLGDRKLVEWLAAVETPGVRQIREIAAPTCAKAINAHFLFAGRLELNRDPPMHKSATCIVVDAKDFGDPYDRIGDRQRGSDLNEFKRVVVKFMSNADQFNREIESRKLHAAKRCSEPTEQPFLVPCITYFDTSLPSTADAHYERDIRESADVFGHDLLCYPYAILMHRADRNFDSIYRHEVPSMLRIRAYMEELAKKLELLHKAGKIHADVKLLNIVRLDGLLTIIDMDASRNIKIDNAGSKFSSGILPPEMIYKLKNEEEEEKHFAYWKDAKKDFMTVQRIVEESDSRMPDALSEYLEKERHVQPNMIGQRLELYCEQSKTVKELLTTSAESSEDFYHIWTHIRKNEALWRKVMPFEDPQKGEYVVRSFRHDAKSDDILPYELVLADASLDMWSLGVLLFKLCTKTDLFRVNGVNDDLLDGEGYAELCDWDLSTEKCEAKLARVENELARDLLRRLLGRDPESRPHCMEEVLGHDFFRPDYSKRKLSLEEEVSKLQREYDGLFASKTQEKQLLGDSLTQELERQQEELERKQGELERKQEELKIWKRPINSLAQDRCWDALIDRVKKSPDAIPTDLLLVVCRYGPKVEVVKAIAKANCDLVKTCNTNRDLPLHVACCYGITVDVVKQLIGLHPRSISEQNVFDETPLDIAQSTQWTHAGKHQNDVIRYLRRECHPDYFDDMTGLPRSAALDKWAHLPPPSVQKADAKVFVLNIDISGFKAVNDNTKDHKIGDNAIRKYAKNITKTCEKYEASAKKSSMHLLIDVFRPGGDEFVVTAKFAKSCILGVVWTNMVKPLIEALGDLTFDDSEEPCRYCTFLRIGCCTGNLDRMDDILKKADKLQCEKKEEIGLERGDFISLRELRGKGISNFSEEYFELM